MKLPAVARRASWNLIDQMISSLTNAILSFMVARAVDPTTFGGFAVAFTVFALVIGGARAACTSPLNIRFSDADPAEQKRAAAAATGLSLLIAVVVGLGTVAAGLLLGGSTGEALLVMGLVLPAVIVQDSYRYVFFSRQTPAMAAVNDGAWAVLQIGAVAVLLSLGVTSVGPFVLVWGIAGAAAVLLALRQSATLPAPRRALGWLREQNDLTRYTFASWATQQGTMQGALLVIAAIGSVVANGALRGAQILLGPATIISSSALTFAIPEFSRRRRTMTDRQWLLAACGVSGVVALLALCWGAVFLLMPDAVGQYLLNETWAGTEEVLLAAVVGQVLASLTVGPVVMLYAIDRAKATFRIHLVLGALVFLGGVVGVVVAGGPGAQWGFAIANGLVLPFWFVRLWRELRARSAAGPEPEGPDLHAGLGDAEATTVLATRYRRPPGHYVHDLESAQMATMVLPRITPVGRPPGPPGPPGLPPGVRPSPGPRPWPGFRPAPGPRPAGGPRGVVPPGAVPPGAVPPGALPPGAVPPGAPPPGPPGFAVPVPHGAAGLLPQTGRPGGPPPPSPPPPSPPPDVAPDQATRAHVLPPPPPPRPSPRPRPRPDQATPGDATPTVVTPAPSGAEPAPPAPESARGDVTTTVVTPPPSAADLAPPPPESAPGDVTATVVTPAPSGAELAPRPSESAPGDTTATVLTSTPVPPGPAPAAPAPPAPSATAPTPAAATPAVPTPPGSTPPAATPAAPTSLEPVPAAIGTPAAAEGDGAGGVLAPAPGSSPASAPPGPAADDARGRVTGAAGSPAPSEVQPPASGPDHATAVHRVGPERDRPGADDRVHDRIDDRGGADDRRAAEDAARRGAQAAPAQAGPGRTGPADRPTGGDRPEHRDRVDDRDRDDRERPDDQVRPDRDRTPVEATVRGAGAADDRSPPA